MELGLSIRQTILQGKAENRTFVKGMNEYSPTFTNHLVWLFPVTNLEIENDTYFHAKI